MVILDLDGVDVYVITKNVSVEHDNGSLILQVPTSSLSIGIALHL